MKCRGCGTELSADARFCGMCGAAVISHPDEATMVQPSGLPSQNDSSSPYSSGSHGRFLPGTVIGERFRIIALLGRGGMGEVFRADDLKLGQPVALKFLPKNVAGDKERLSRLYAEVRVARQISHPNVCRVYDIGEIEGHHFLSMEYIEGEDLATLLKRIGRLPEQKAIQIARQIAAGLAAAHDQKVLHRDLKPANVMLDERGIVRLTDFGLAALIDDLGKASVSEGTPAYMAPEQLDGTAVSVRSDIYSLGLVFYEIFTGKRAFDARTYAELIQLRGTSSPSAPSEIVPDLNPAIERVILGCLESDPRNRPPSAAAVAAALPGGDPLAAAIAAGETPSPELLMAAGDATGMKVSHAVACVALILASMAVAVWFAGTASLAARFPLRFAPDALAAKARDAARQFGYTHQPYSAYGFSIDGERLRKARDSKDADRWERLARAWPPIFEFWYRESPRPLVPVSPFAYGRPTLTDPPPVSLTGMYSLAMDGAGHLTYFSATTPQIVEAAAPKSVDWQRAFTLAELEMSRFTSTVSQWTPIGWGDVRTAWTAPAKDPKQPAVRIEAAAHQGKLIYFKGVSPGERPWRDVPVSATRAAEEIMGAVGFGIIAALIVAAAFIARRNFRLGRGDRRGAFRLALGVFILQMLVWICNANHVLGAEELALLIPPMSNALLIAGLVWLFYVALEPFARRRWPRMFVTWNRLLGLQLRDPRLASDVLVGLALACAGDALARLVILFNARTEPLPNLIPFDVDVLSGGLHLVTPIFSVATAALASGFGMCLLLLVLRMIVRHDIAAAAILVVLSAMPMLVMQATSHWWISLLIGLFGATISMVLLFRFGFVAFIAGILDALPLNYPLLPRPWEGSEFTAYFGVGVVVLITAWAFRTALAGKPLLSDHVFEG